MLSFTKRDLERENNLKFAKDLYYSPAAYQNNDRLLALRDVKISGSGYYQNDLELFAVNLVITGIMVVPCAISLKAVDYPFTSELVQTYAFGDTSDSEQIKVENGFIDLEPEILQMILMDVPLKVVAENAIYEKGENWEIITEAQYNSEKENALDPRLLKLKEFKLEDDKEE